VPVDEVGECLSGDAVQAEARINPGAIAGGRYADTSSVGL
jgi:hypothetical protein